MDTLCAGTGRSLGRPVAIPGWPASGRRGAEADDVRPGEVRLRHSSEETCEQGRHADCGADGAKGGDRGERGTATHAPGAEPGKRVPEAGTRTTSSKVEEEGAVHGAAAPYYCRFSGACLLCASAQSGTGS